MINITELHKDLGGEQKNKPSLFMRMMKLRDDEYYTKQGRYGGGTFVKPHVAALYREWAESGARISFRARRDKEYAALATIEQILGANLTRQFEVLDYRIDGYDEENKIAYEIDERGHKTTSAYAKDYRRQKKIEKKLGCKFVRISLD